MNARLAVALACATAITLATTTPARSAPSHRGELQQLRKSRDLWKARALAYRRQRDQARRAITAGLPDQMRVLASQASIMRVNDAVFDPLRLAWPCGASIFQGQYTWSLTLDLTYSYFDGERAVERRCDERQPPR